MNAIRLAAVADENGTVTLRGLPVRPGQSVEVIVLPGPEARDEQAALRLRGLPVQYHRPFDPVDEGEWEALQ